MENTITNIMDDLYKEYKDPTEYWTLEDKTEFQKEISKAFAKDRLNLISPILDSLYEQIKHGDKEHQEWLKNKIEEFKKTI